MRILYIFFSIVFLSCNNEESKLIRKKIENGDVTIKWYYYSHITSTSPDFIEIERDKSKIEIYKAKMVIVDLVLKEKNIIIKLVEPSRGKIFTKNVPHEVFGYKIILDTSGDYNQLPYLPKGIKE